LNRKKWHILNTNTQRPELPKEEPTTRQKLQHWLFAQIVVHTIFTTLYVANVVTTEVKLQLSKLRYKLSAVLNEYRAVFFKAAFNLLDKITEHEQYPILWRSLFLPIFAQNFTK
jgi:hypothetical protein